MVRGLLFGLFRTVDRFIHNPIQVLWFCLALAFINLIADGTLFRLWTLRRDYSEVQNQAKIHQVKLAQVTDKIRAAKDPAFFEKQARDRFNLVSEGDLVFVFTEDE